MADPLDTTALDARALAGAGMQALQAGDAQSARAAFDRIVAAGIADASICLALAWSCAGLKDEAAALAAVDRALALEPRNLRALIFKADRLDAAGDTRGASYFYQAALGNAPPAAQLPADLRAELARAQAMGARYSAKFESFLRERVLRAEGGGQVSTRFAQSVDILFGKKKIYFQEPQNYFFPELPQIQFYDRAAFPWLDRVEAATADIRAELEQIMREDAAFEPYVQSGPLLPRQDQDGMLNNPAWSAFYLWKNGDVVQQNAARCPRTMRALEHVPPIRVKNRSPSILFSKLTPGTRIPPHTGRVNTRLICHLPLLVPENCALRVGNDTRTVVEGKAWAFDDTIEHEAWNLSAQNRVVLIFEIWRPELTAQERDLVCAMFEAIDAQSGDRPAWDI